MNEALKTALQEARTAAEAALSAAQAGDHDEARRQLALLDDLREHCSGGNAAAGASRAKTLRIEAETLSLLDAARPEISEPTQVEVPEVQPVPEVSEAAQMEVPDAAPEVPQDAPAEAAVADSTPAAQEAAPEPTQAKPRQAASPHAYTAEGWALVAAGLRAAGEEADELDRDAAQFDAQRAVARTERDTFRAKVCEGQALQAQVEAAALRGDVEAANAAWDRLFDVVTAIRSMEGTHRRKNGGQADPFKAACYDAAREGRLKISQWSQGRGVSA
ncbi:hypothetical protein D3875_04355 [Deinococcus cavernae]|uniref:Uncharacterized protein n=1 Tax=Deinococcus cavernae TaxID=2320857 RepID=A0A418VEM4_9DEIO|nr:hypothetical protein [Deinococcus cavernae]RJF74518.1 hypothetical protein D3875_04355 [Deinococcus cavernae]